MSFPPQSFPGLSGEVGMAREDSSPTACGSGPMAPLMQRVGRAGSPSRPPSRRRRLHFHPSIYRFA